MRARGSGAVRMGGCLDQGWAVWCMSTVSLSFPACFPASSLTGLVEGSRCGSNGLIWIFGWSTRAVQSDAAFMKASI